MEVSNLNPWIAKSLTVRGPQLRTAMDRLAPEYREALILRKLAGLAYKEIAAIQGIPIGTVVRRLARAGDALTAEWMDQKDVLS